MLFRPPRLKPVNKSRRKLLDEHLCAVVSRLERHDAELADRDPNGDVFQRLNARLFEMEPGGIPDARPLERESTVRQSVQIFRPVTMDDTLHPDARRFFEPDELAEVIDPAKPVLVLNRELHRHFDYIEGSEHDALVGFQSAEQEKADLHHEKKRKERREKNLRRAKRAGYKVAEDLAAGLVTPEEVANARKEHEKFADIRREHSAEVHDRLKYGFYYPGGKIAGEVVGTVFEFFGPGILRSRLGSPSLARMAALYPRADSGRLRGGYDKTFLLESTCKLFALDAPYVELNRKVLGCIVVELDSVLRVEEFRIKLLEILGPHRMPNLITGSISPSGFLVRPHLIWILKNPVWADEYYEWTNPKTGATESRGYKECKRKPVAKYCRVQRGLTQLLLPLGADPSCNNIWKPKNPLSPFWTTIIANDDCWHELGDFDLIRNWPKKVDEHAMAETAATMRANATGTVTTPSNLAWKTVGHVIEPLARLQLSVRDDDFSAAVARGVDALSVWFDNRVRATVEAELGPSEGLDRILKGRCAFAARYCIGKIKNGKKRKVRGRDRDLITDEMTVAERQGVAGSSTDSGSHTVFMHKLVAEMEETLRTTGAIRKTDFIKTLKTVGKSAAYDHWDEACEKLDLEFRDGVHRKKARGITANTIIPSSSSFFPPVIQPLELVGVMVSSFGYPSEIGESKPPGYWNLTTTADPPDHQQPNHAHRPAEACPDTVNHMLEPA